MSHYKQKTELIWFIVIWNLESRWLQSIKVLKSGNFPEQKLKQVYVIHRKNQRGLTLTFLEIKVSERSICSPPSHVLQIPGTRRNWYTLIATKKRARPNITSVRHYRSNSMTTLMLRKTLGLLSPQGSNATTEVSAYRKRYYISLPDQCTWQCLTDLEGTFGQVSRTCWLYQGLIRDK